MTTASTTKTTTGTKAKPKAEAKPKAVPRSSTTVAATKPIKLTIGEYEVTIEGTEEKAIAKVIARGSDVILEEEVTRQKLPPVAELEREVSAMELAKLKAIEAYHEATEPTSGLIDLNALVEHPYNSLIYGQDESVDDLVQLLEKEDGQVFRLTINDKGQLLAGNRRYKAAKIVNERCLEKKESPKFEFVPVEILTFSSPESEIKFMILDNQSRVKTKKQIAAEVERLIALSTSSAIPFKERLRVDDAISSIQDVLQTNRSSAYQVKNALEAVKGYENKEIAERIKTLAVTIPNKAKDVVEAAPPKLINIDKEVYQEKLLDHLEANPKDSVKKAVEAVNTELVAKKVDGVQDIEKLIEAAKAAGDRASDNRKTPSNYIELALDAMQHIDLDSFAMVDDPGYVPASTAYTILDNAFSKEHCGNVFANPPFSKASEAIALLDDEICNGHTRRLFLILPASVQSSKAYHQFLKNHQPMMLQPAKRLAFEPGLVLKREDPKATAEGNREPSVILFWSDNEGDYNEFYNSAINYGNVWRQYAPFNPMQLPALFNDIKWYDEKGRLSAKVFGSFVQIIPSPDPEGMAYEVKINNDIHDEVFSSPETAKIVGIMGAIAALTS